MKKVKIQGNLSQDSGSDEPEENGKKRKRREQIGFPPFFLFFSKPLDKRNQKR
ncbi:MAG: hypothetical protein IKP74_02930 [Clostridia bacterium]|nr:hypothetical protein [Clostridia bacterium]